MRVSVVALTACLMLINAGAALAQPTATAGAAGTAPGAPPRGYRDPYADKKRLLIIADLSTGNQSAHIGSSHAVSVIEQIGRKAGAYISIIRTDTDLVTKGEVWGTGEYAKGGRRQARGRNLDYFDAVLFYTNGETRLTAQQKQDLLDFIAKDGKGFVGVHTATATAASWPEYQQMIGGSFDNHPWGITKAKIIVERPDFPAMKRLKTGSVLEDEHYQMLPTPYSRADVDVLARLDTRGLDMTLPGVHRKDGDFPVAWIKSYGKGRVFYSGLGHPDAAWDDPRVQMLFLEGIKWAISGGQAPKPHAMTAVPK